MSVALADELATEAIAVRSGDRVRVLVANLTDESRRVSVAMSGLARGMVRTLDDATYEAAAGNATFFAAEGGEPVAATGGGFTVELGPFAVARIDGEVSV